MENLIIKNNSGSENIGSDVLLKVYELALLTSGTLLLSGNIIVPHAKQSVLDYFENNFPDLHITLTGLKYIDFVDPVVAWHIAKSYDTDGIGITLSDLNSINWITTSMLGNTLITSFNELSLFTNINTIKREAFKGCTSLSSIDLSNITSIEQSAFAGCTSLTSIDISNCTSIGGSAFLNCTGLTRVIFPSGNYLIPSGQAFRYCTNLVQDIDLTNCTTANLFATYSNVFARSGITSIKTSQYITSLGSYNNGNESIFFECVNLQKADFTLSTLLTSINGERMFLVCKNLKYVKFPSTVTEFLNEIFFNWESAYNFLNTIKIYLPCTTPPTMTSHTLSGKSGNGTVHPTLEIYVPTGSISAYLSDSDWSQYTILDIANYSET